MNNVSPLNGRKVHPNSLNVRTVSRLLEIEFEDGRRYELPFELLRVYSPSAEVRGHGAGQEVLQTGKRMVGISGIEPVGNYAIKPIFTDEHATGIFTWEYLYWLGENQAQLWADYMNRLQSAGFLGESGRDVLPTQKSNGKCG